MLLCKEQKHFQNLQISIINDQLRGALTPISLNDGFSANNNDNNL